MFVVVISCFVTDNWKLAIISCSGLSLLLWSATKSTLHGTTTIAIIYVVIILCLCLWPWFCNLCVFIFVHLRHFFCVVFILHLGENDNNYFAWNVVNNSSQELKWGLVLTFSSEIGSVLCAVNSYRTVPTLITSPDEYTRFGKQQHFVPIQMIRGNAIFQQFRWIYEIW